MGVPEFDAFARARVSEPVTLFDSQLQYNAQPLLWETSGDGTATHVPAKAAMQLSVAEGESVVRQSRPYIRYQPGKSQLILLTGVLGAATEGVTKRIGYFDGDNGIFFELTSEGMFICKRSSVTGTAVDKRVALADATELYPLSASSINPEKSLIFYIDLEWLGVGSVRCGFVIDGMPFVVHEFKHAGLITGVYMTTANLPLRYEMISTTGTADDMYQICASVQSEGGFREELGLPHSVANGATGISVASRRSVLAIRPKATFNSLVNRGTIIPESVDILVATAPAYYEVIYGGALGGSPSWASAGDNSIVEYDVAGTTVTGGEVLVSGYVVTGGAGGTARGAAVAGLVSKLPLVLDTAGENPIVLAVVMTGVGGTPTAYAALNWRELY